MGQAAAVRLFTIHYRPVPGFAKAGSNGCKATKSKYVPKLYEPMYYPEQRVQVDVKFVPASCLVGDAKGEKFYQYTAIDEYSRFRYLKAFSEHSTYSSRVFLEHMLKAFKFKAECVQTDNGAEFTRHLSNEKPTLFEQTLASHGIRHKRIRVFTPRHDGKVERSHRKDNEYFYALHSFFHLMI